jgi:glucosamine-6-phosphate deaminase
MLVIVAEDYDEMSKAAAKKVAELVRSKPTAVLGLATGSTPKGLYQEMIRMHKNEGLDFSKVTTFNLDEYIGLTPDHPESYNYYMRENLFNEINVDERFIHVPQGMLDVNNIPAIEEFCRWYEEQIEKVGGIDLQILGIGVNGHIAFNEPGSSLGSRTRVKTLTDTTRLDNSQFFKSVEEVPKYAITMGVGTIMEAKELLLLANGRAKANAIRTTVEGPITAMVPATIVQMHAKATLIVDKEAASELTGKYEGWIV